MVKSVLFVCLGNICRSPIAEGIFLHLIKERGTADSWKVDSAAIGAWHIGKPPDHRAAKVMKDHNIQYNNTARKITAQDFKEFDYIFGMDDENINDLEEELAKVPNSKAQILLLGDYDPQGERIIRDPYYDSNAKGFDKVYVQALRCCNAFLDKQI